MNGKQRIALLIGIGVIVVMGLYAPWWVETKRSYVDPSCIVSGGYAFLFKPPKYAAGIELTRLFVQCSSCKHLYA